MRPLFVFACLTALTMSALAQDAVPAPAIDPKAKQVLDGMSAYYKMLKSFTCKYTLDFIVEGEGKREAETMVSEVAMERPNKVYMKQVQNELGVDLFSDGLNLAVHVPQVKSYTVMPAPADFDGSFQYASVSGLTSFQLIVANLMSADPAATFLNGGAELSYIGLEDVGTQKHHHLRINRQNQLLDMWVADGDKPFLARVAPDLSKETEGTSVKLSLTVNLTDWAPDALIAPEKFAFVAPATATKADSFGEMFAKEESRPAEELLGLKASTFSLAGLDGKPVDLSTYLGKNIVVLDFWATWCGPCVKAMPILTAVTDSLKDKGVVLIAVNQGETAEEVSAFLKERNLNVIVALDADQEVGTAYKVTGIPQSVIIGKDGTVQSVHIGIGPDFEAELTKELTTLIEGKNLITPKSAS